MQLPRKRRLMIAVATVVAMVGLTAAGFSLWYTQQLRPYDVRRTATSNFEVKKGWTGAQAVRALAQQAIIRSEPAALLYLRLHGLGANLKAGVYVVNPSQSTPDILDHIMNGKIDQRSITFYPGAVLEVHPQTPNKNKQDVRSVLLDAGFDSRDIDTAFRATYQGRVYQSKPVEANLEGLVYGETFFISTSATPKQIIQRSLDEFDRVIRENDFERKFAKHGLSLYQGLILASIVQRESLGCPGQAVCDDQRQIAAVFYNRLAMSMPLGSDVTYHYIADKTGVARDFRLESPYNTRRVTGLPPTPIASPGMSALNAVADPVSSDYLFFLSGDDNTTYFAKTDAEHQRNIAEYCHKKCSLP